MFIRKLYGCLTNEEIYSQANFILEQNFNDALKIANKLIINYPKNSECYFLRGDLFLSENKYAEAINDYDIGIKINDNNAIYFHTRGSALIETGEFLEAVDDFEIILENKDLTNRKYVLDSTYAFRTIAYCCIGEWEKCYTDINYINDNFITYLHFIKNKIDKKRLEECISNHILLQ